MNDANADPAFREILGDLTKVSVTDPEDSLEYVTDTEEKKMNFFRMPQEILVHIFSYIDADYLLNVVSKVCKELHVMLSDDQYWKLRLYQRYPKDFPIVHVPDFSMAQSSGECMAHWKIWKMSNALQKKIVLSPPSGSTVDCVHMTEDRKLCISGGRDRSMTVWKLDPESGANYDTDSKEMFYKYLTNHKGWVWSIISRPGEICSTSFDTTVKFWDMNSLDMTLSINMRGAVLCSSYISDYTMAVGCFNRSTLILDTRSGSIEHTIGFHRGSVLKIHAEDNYIVSTGQGGHMVFVDIRNMKMLQRIKTDSFAMALSAQGKQIWTGNKNGSILVYDAENLGGVFEAATLDYGFSGKITSLQYTDGAVFSGSTDGWLKIYQPTLNPDCLGEIQLKGEGVTDIALVDNRLAVANGNGLVTLWDPTADLSEEEYDFN